MSVQRWWSGVIAVAFAISGCSEQAEVSDDTTSSAPRMGVEGAWRVVLLKQADSEAVTAPPGIYVFASDHYSMVYSNTASRTRFAKADAATDAEKLGAYNSIIANAGTYVMTGDTLTVRPVISRNPNFMGGGEDTFMVSFAGDTLTLSSVPGAFRWATGPATAPSVDSIVLVRAR